MKKKTNFKLAAYLLTASMIAVPFETAAIAEDTTVNLEAEAPAAEEPSKETPAAEEPVKEAPAAEEPAKEAPAQEEPAKEAPAAEEPAKETPVPEEPSKEAPVPEAPAKEKPAEKAPEEPAKEKPADEAPAEKTPETEKSAEIKDEKASDEKKTEETDARTEEEKEPDEDKDPIAEKKVRIFCTGWTGAKPGDELKLESSLQGFEDCDKIAYQWMVNKGDGFREIEGATQNTYSFTATEENLKWGYKLAVYFK